jgi:cell division protein FtsW
MSSRSEAITGGRGREARAAAKVAGSLDSYLTVVATALVLLGLVMILSASSVSSFATYGSPFLFFKRQVLWAVIGVVAFIALSRIDYRKLRKIGPASYLVVLAMLLAVAVPGIGVTSGGSSRWIGIGPLALQPSEFAKLALILFIAFALSGKREQLLKRFAHTALPVVPAVCIFGALVIWQPDLGTALLFGVIGTGMLFVAGAPIRFISGIALAGGMIATAAALLEPYRRGRILSFLNPWSDPLNTGYQVIQSLIALGSGGWFGVGLGASRQKWLYIPNAHTDFIYAIIGEEMGLLGTVVVLGLFAFLAYLGIRVARSAPDRFGMLLAAGITIWLSGQALVNMGAVTGSLPITGVPLPLVSFGGSSLVASLAAVGILCSIARASRLSRIGDRQKAGI